MRMALVCTVILLIGWTASAQVKIPPRYGLDYNATTYPQTSPQENLDSALKAINSKRIDYLLAHLSDPEFVDDRVKVVHKGKFDAFVQEVSTRLVNDPDSIKLIQKFARDGEWETADAAASVKLKDVKDRMFFRKIKDRWFLENDKKKVEKAETK